jgi:meso-butanediol dehydrogenase/(S,S)-butanediol dehydrogenase/diacetyl reductase
MSTSRFNNKVVFITGGSSGLGKATAGLFAAEGARLFITDLEERDVLKSMPERAQAKFMTCDVSDPMACETAINACVSHFGRLDVLFHCAGSPGAINPVTRLPIETFQRTININLCSVFYLARVAIPHMSTKNGGRGGSIVNIASTSGMFGDYGLCAYNAAKAGVINLTKAMAVDHAAEGVRVNAVCPGYMVTPMTTAFTEHEIMKSELLSNIPLGRGCDPVEVGKAVLYLASEDASYTTGTALVVDGGWTSRYAAPNFTKYLSPEEVC